MYPFIQARNYTPTSGRTIDYIVVHDMEFPERSTAAEDVALFFHNQQPSPVTGSSAHYCADNNSVIQCVHEKDVAWHAPGCNHNGVGIEHAGYAKQSRSDWLDEYGKALLAVSADLAHGIAERYHIPVIHRTAADLLRGLRGFTGHVDVTNAFHRSTHTDPGYGFPWDYYLSLVNKTPITNPPEHDVKFDPIEHGDTGWRVKMLQQYLNALPYIKVGVDGAFGDYTEKAVKQFQEKAGIQATGKVGEPTWKALLAAQSR